MALMNRKLRQHGGDRVPDAARALHVHLLAPHQGSGLASAPRSPAWCRRSSRSAWPRSSPETLSERRSPMLADRLKTLAPSPTLAMQAKAKAHARAGHRRDLVRRRRAGLRHAGAHQGRGRSRDASRARPSTPRSAACPSCAPPSARSSSATTGSTTSPTRCTVSCGAKHTLYNLFMALVNPGDEVLIPSPYWVSYPEQVRLLGGVPVPVATPEATGFDLDPAELRRAVTPRTKMIVLNSPNNPTGAVFSRGGAGRGGAAGRRARSVDRLRRVLRGADLRGAPRLHRVALAPR